MPKDQIPSLHSGLSDALRTNQWESLFRTIQRLLPEFEKAARPDLCLLAQSVSDLSLHLQGAAVQASRPLGAQLESRIRVLIRELEFGIEHLRWKQTSGEPFEALGASYDREKQEVVI